MPHILLADDNVILTELWREALEDEGYEVTLARSGSEAVALLNSQEFDLVVTDMNMPSGGGFAVTTGAKSVNANIPIVVISGDSVLLSSGMLGKMTRLGAAHVAVKPVDVTELIRIVGKCLKHRSDRDILVRFREIIDVVRNWKTQKQNGG